MDITAIAVGKGAITHVMTVARDARTPADSNGNQVTISGTIADTGGTKILGDALMDMSGRNSSLAKLPRVPHLKTLPDGRLTIMTIRIVPMNREAEMPDGEGIAENDRAIVAPDMP